MSLVGVCKETEKKGGQGRKYKSKNSNYNDQEKEYKMELKNKGNAVSGRVLAEIEITKLLVPESRGKMMSQKVPVPKNADLNR